MGAMMTSHDDSSTFGFRVPRGLVKPVTDFVAKFLHNMADNPVAVVLSIVLGLHLYAFHFAATTIMPAHVASIEAGYQRQSISFIEAVAKMQAENAKAAEKAHGDFAKEWEREREFLREIKELLRDRTAFLPGDAAAGSN